jgi:hypothetical protein
VKRTGRLDCEAAARRVRELAAFYGIREQQLATHLGFALGGPAPAPPAA